MGGATDTSAGGVGARCVAGGVGAIGAEGALRTMGGGELSGVDF